VASRTPTEPDRRQAERYEPLPGVVELPGWIWRKLGRRGRIAVLASLLAVAALAAALAPGILESKEEQAETERRQRAERRALLIRRLEAEQRPRFRRSSAVAPPGAGAEERLGARATLMDELSAALLADARRRVRRGDLDGPIRRVGCEPFPRTVDGVGADQDLSRRRGRYSCVAVTAEFEAGVEGVIGHQYRVEVDFDSGRYAFCKISGQAGPSREQLVTTPRACGGT
jgi:hypothetical protein